MTEQPKGVTRQPGTCHAAGNFEILKKNSAQAQGKQQTHDKRCSVGSGVGQVGQAGRAGGGMDMV